jgi:hypothetical protein
MNGLVLGPLIHVTVDAIADRARENFGQGGNGIDA